MKKTTIFHQSLYGLKPKLILACLVLGAAFSSAHAQEVGLTSGGNLAGGGGSASYSVGQTIQNTLTSADGSAIQGIQFYFKDATLQIIDMETHLDIAAYPNPTTSILNIITDYQSNTLVYDLVDITGRHIINGKVTNKTTPIQLDRLDAATYLLKVHNKKTQVTKTFKIIKN